MAWKLKTGKTYTTPQGIELDSIYVAVDEIINEKRVKHANVIIKVYQSKQKADENPKSNQLESISINVNDTPAQGLEGEEGYIEACTDFTDYFSVSAVATKGNEYKLAYNYIKDKKKKVGGILLSDLSDVL